MAVTAFRLVEGAEPTPGYRLESFLGRGGFGEVWRATAPGGFNVALKFMVIDEAGSERELRALRMLQHVRDGHLLNVQGIWQIPGYVMLAMELADCTLADRCNEYRKQGLPGVPREELVRWFGQAAAGIDFLNESRHVLEPGGKAVAIQHADVKPQNLLLIGSACKVGDFGLLRLLGSSSTQKTSSMTAAYAPPEVFAGKPARSSDQYSLAVTWCCLRSGRLPFEGGPVQLMYAHVNTPADVTMLPEGERPVVAKALSKQAGERWPSCAAFVEALRDIKAGDTVVPSTRLERALATTSDISELTRTETQPARATRTVAVGDSGRPAGRGRMLPWLSLAVLATVVAGLAVLWWVHPPGRNDAPDGKDAGKGNTNDAEAITAEVGKRQEYERRLTAGRKALAAKQFGDAMIEANEALKLFTNDQAATTLKEDARSAKDRAAAALNKQEDFDRFISSGNTALLRKEYIKAIQDAEEALKLFPDDQTALNLKKDSLTGQDNVAAALKKKRNFEQLIALGEAALAGQKYEDAIKNAEGALQLFPDDLKALALKKDAQSGVTAAALKVKKKQDYERHLSAGREAVQNKKHDDALQDVEEALQLFPNDPESLKLKKDIQLARDKSAVEKTPRTRSADGAWEIRINSDKLECIERPSGKTIWRYGGSVLGFLLSDDDRLVCAIDENVVYAFDTKTGKEAWRNQPRPPVRFSRISIGPDKETVIAVTQDGQMLEFSMRTGQPRTPPKK